MTLARHCLVCGGTLPRHCLVCGGTLARLCWSVWWRYNYCLVCGRMLPCHCLVCVVTSQLGTLPRNCLVCVVTLALLSGLENDASPSLSGLWEDITPSLSGLCGGVSTIVWSEEWCYHVTGLREDVTPPLSGLLGDVTPSLSGLCGVVTTAVLSVGGRYPVTVWSWWLRSRCHCDYLVWGRSLSDHCLVFGRTLPRHCLLWVVTFPLSLSGQCGDANTTVYSGWRRCHHCLVRRGDVTWLLFGLEGRCYPVAVWSGGKMLPGRCLEGRCYPVAVWPGGGGGGDVSPSLVWGRTLLQASWCFTPSQPVRLYQGDGRYCDRLVLCMAWIPRLIWKNRGLSCLKQWCHPLNGLGNGLSRGRGR